MQREEQRPVLDAGKVKPVDTCGERKRPDERAFICEEGAVNKVCRSAVLWKPMSGMNMS
jgi:hypothetical protein